MENKLLFMGVRNKGYRAYVYADVTDNPRHVIGFERTINREISFEKPLFKNQIPGYIYPVELTLQENGAYNIRFDKGSKPIATHSDAEELRRIHAAHETELAAQSKKLEQLKEQIDFSCLDKLRVEYEKLDKWKRRALIVDIILYIESGRF